MEDILLTQFPRPLKWGHFERTKLVFKILPISLSEIIFKAGFRSFQRGTVYQGTTKQQTVKFGDQKKSCRLAHHAPGLGLSPGKWDHPQSLMYPNFAAL